MVFSHIHFVPTKGLNISQKGDPTMMRTLIVKRYGVSVLIGALLLLAFGPPVDASIIPIGSSFTLHPTNAPDNYSATITFGSTVLVDNGAAQLSMSQVSTGTNSEWDIWKLTTVGGGPIAGNVNANWNITMDYVLSQNANFDAVENQWTVNGVGVTPTGNISAISAPNSNLPALGGGGYYNSGFSSLLTAGTQANLQQIFVNPYNIVSQGGINASTANGFNWALHFTAVPEPSSGIILALATLAALSRRRRVDFSAVRS